LLVLGILRTEKNRIQTKGLMGFEPPSGTINSITRQRQYDRDYCDPAFSQVNVLLRVVIFGYKIMRFNVFIAK
jgi:hypothetical protein